jgi:chromosome segregation ATPase
LIHPFLQYQNKVDKRIKESEISIGSLSKDTENPKDSTSIFLKENYSITNDGSNSFTFNNKNSKIDKSSVRQENERKQELMRMMLQYEDLKKQNDNLINEKKDQMNQIKRLEEENSDLNRKIRDLNDLNLNQTLSLNELETRFTIVTKENERLNSFLSNFLQNSNYFQETIHQNMEIINTTNSKINPDMHNSIVPSTNRYFYETLKYYREELDQKINLINQKNREVESWRKAYEENEENCKSEIEKLKQTFEKAIYGSQIKNDQEYHSVCEKKWEASQKELNEVKLKTSLLEDEIKKINYFLKKEEKMISNQIQNTSFSSDTKNLNNNSNMKLRN